MFRDECLCSFDDSSECVFGRALLATWPRSRSPTCQKRRTRSRPGQNHRGRRHGDAKSVSSDLIGTVEGSRIHSVDGVHQSNFLTNGLSRVLRLVETANRT
jgi:hypothetical protein